MGAVDPWFIGPKRWPQCPIPTGASHTISNLEEGEEYEVKVRASYGGSAGPWSDTSTVTVARTG